LISLGNKSTTFRFHYNRFVTDYQRAASLVFLIVEPCSVFVWQSQQLGDGQFADPVPPSSFDPHTHYSGFVED
jgi:hypothetical protein